MDRVAHASFAIEFHNQKYQTYLTNFKDATNLMNATDLKDFTYPTNVSDPADQN